MCLDDMPEMDHARREDRMRFVKRIEAHLNPKTRSKNLDLVLSDTNPLR